MCLPSFLPTPLLFLSVAIVWIIICASLAQGLILALIIQLKMHLSSHVDNCYGSEFSGDFLKHKFVMLDNESF